MGPSLLSNGSAIRYKPLTVGLHPNIQPLYIVRGENFFLSCEDWTGALWTEHVHGRTGWKVRMFMA